MSNETACNASPCYALWAQDSGSIGGNADDLRAHLRGSNLPQLVKEAFAMHLRRIRTLHPVADVALAIESFVDGDKTEVKTA